MIHLVLVNSVSAKINTHFIIQSNKLKPNDSICLKFFKYGIDCSDKFLIVQGYKVNDTIAHRLLLKIEEPGVVSVSYYRKGKYIGGLLGSYYLEPGDSIIALDDTSNTTPYQSHFMGKGNQKFNILAYLMYQENHFSNKYPNYTHLDSGRIDALNLLTREQLEYINTNTNGMCERALMFLRSHVLLYCETSKYQALNLKKIKSNLYFENGQYQNNIAKLANNNPGNIGELFFYLKQKSNYYTSSNDNDSNYESLYNLIKKTTTGMVRQHLLLEFFLRERATSFSICLNDALPLFDNIYYIRLLKELDNNIGLGHYAYNFKLEDSLGTIHSLSNFKGKVVVLDFWFTGCINCIKLKPFLQKIEAQYSKDSIQFITISIDQDKQLWVESLRKQIYTSAYSLNLKVSSLNNKLSEIKKFNIKSYPALVVIDKNGKIANTPIDPRFDNGNNLISIIERLL